MKHDPFFKCCEEKDSAPMCFRIYLALHGYQVDLKELRMVFRYKKAGVSLKHFLDGLAYYQVTYQELVNFEFFKKNYRNVVLKKQHHYQLIYKRFAFFYIVADPLYGWRIYTENQLKNLHIENFIHLKFPGHYPYVNSQETTIMSSLHFLLCLLPAFISFILTDVSMALSLGLLILISTFYTLNFYLYSQKIKKFSNLSIGENAKTKWQQKMTFTQKKILLLLIVFFLDFLILRYYPRYRLLYVFYVFFIDILLDIIFQKVINTQSEDFSGSIKLFIKILFGIEIYFLLLIGMFCLQKPMKFVIGPNLATVLFLVVVHPLIICLILSINNQIILFDTDEFDQWFKVASAVKPSFKKIEGIGINNYYYDQSVLIIGDEKQIHDFYYSLHGPNLIINGIATSRYGLLDHLDHIIFYQNFLYLDLEKTVFELFDGKIEDLLVLLEALDLFKYCFFLKTRIEDLSFATQELFGFLRLLLDEKDFCIIESAFLYQDEKMVEKCLWLIKKRKDSPKFILTIPTIKLMNQENICAIIKSEKVG